MPTLVAKVLLFSAITALAALVANRALSTYHDGLRPLMPEYRRGDLPRATIGRKAWDISIGFILFYALPFSLVNGVMVSHTIFLAADVLGLRQARAAAALAIGAMYGAAITVAIDLVFRAIQHLPVHFLPDMIYLIQPMGYLLGLMPVIAVAQQYGVRLGTLGLAIAMVVRIGTTHLAAEKWIPGLSPDGIALFVGTIFLLALATRRRGRPIPGEARIFASNINNIHRGLPYLIIIAALAALAAHLGWLAGEPAQTLLVSGNRLGDAAAVALFSAVGFLPLVVSTSVVTGAYSTQGYPDWILGVGYISRVPIIALIAGTAIVLVEVLGLRRWMQLLGQFPDLRELGPVVRDALTTVTEIATLVGGIVCAHAIWPSAGPLLAGGFYVGNELAGRPVMRLTAGAIGAIGTGLAVNVAYVVGVR